MPELPEVEAVCRKLRLDAVGASIEKARLPRERNRAMERRLAGRKVVEVRRRGKNILLMLDGELALRVHLRMTGNLYVVPDRRLLPITVRAWFAFADGRVMVLDDPRALGALALLSPTQVETLDSELGPEPLSDGFTAEVFLRAAQRTRLSAKLFLMDQTKVAGLGNIYAAEALHRARVHPAKPMNQLSKTKLGRLHRVIVEILTDAVQSACTAYAGPGQFEASETFSLAVYGREGEPCFTCGRRIRRIPQGGRSTYYCPGCQR